MFCHLPLCAHWKCYHRARGKEKWPPSSSRLRGSSPKAGPTAKTVMYGEGSWRTLWICFWMLQDEATPLFPGVIPREAATPLFVFLYAQRCAPGRRKHVWIMRMWKRQESDRMVSYQDLRVQSTTETSDSVKQLLKQENKNATDKKDIRKC